MRAQLRQDYADAGAALGAYLGGLMELALADRPGVPPGEVHQQLIGWIRTDT